MSNIKKLYYDNKELRYTDDFGERYFCVRDVIKCLGYHVATVTRIINILQMYKQTKRVSLPSKSWIFCLPVDNIKRIINHAAVRNNVSAFKKWFYESALTHEDPQTSIANPQSYQVIINGLTGKVFEFYTAMFENQSQKVHTSGIAKFFSSLDQEVKLFISREVKS